MAKRIFRNIVFAAVLAVLLTVVLVVPALYNVHEAGIGRELRREVNAVVCALGLTDDEVAYLSELEDAGRITLIAPDGAVLYDSVADASELPNHARRPEVMQAVERGSSETVRVSETLSETILYCARRTKDGCVLRIGATRRSMLGTFINVLPLILGMLMCVALASLLLARRAAKRIVAPINALDLDAPLKNDTYDELAPLITRMYCQRDQIDRQMHALESAHAGLAAIMANMREGMILLDKNEIVLSANESAASIFDFCAKEAAGQSLPSVCHDADIHEKVHRALRGEGGSLPMKRGGKRYELYASPVMKDETVCGAVLLIPDVTERFAAEMSRREFAANVSHELKTPLTSISGFAEIIRDGVAQPQDVPRFAGMIFKESTRMIALVNDILELSRLDEKQNLGAKEAVALLPLFRELAEDFASAVRKKRQTLCVSGEDVIVFGDSALLRELFFNLIDNAVKYTPEGGRISLAITKSIRKVVCTVADNGAGIPAEHQAHIFERFYRVDKSHSRKSGGTGLGLAIVKHIAQLHQAEIRLNSAPNAGTEIQVIFETPHPESERP